MSLYPISLLFKSTKNGAAQVSSGLAREMLNFISFHVKNHIPFHSDPRIQPYAMILKWRGVGWSGLSHCGGGRL